MAEQEFMLLYRYGLVDRAAENIAGQSLEILDLDALLQRAIQSLGAALEGLVALHPLDVKVLVCLWATCIRGVVVHAHLVWGPYQGW